MKNLVQWCLIFCVVLSVGHVSGQPTKKPCLYNNLTRKTTQESLLARYQVLYKLQPKEKIASVGAGGGNKEILYSMLADSLVFYLQDIDSTCLSKTALQATIQQLYGSTNQLCDDTFKTVLGTEADTKLPEHFFDKILVENTLHELRKPSEIIRSIRKSLKPDGFLFIEDFIARKQGQKHRGCGKVLFTDAALVSLLSDNGFRLIESSYVFPANKVDKLYKFAVSN